ncbi:MAG: protein kinase domain-containing protein, partial [Acidimicrobiales bacterium]
PGVVSTFDTGIDRGTAYIVMELVQGRTLRQVLTEDGPLEPWVAVSVARQIADALAHAHRAGVVHRDIKPANVLLAEDEWGSLRVKVTDFGIAKAGLGRSGDLTRTGMVLGTPKYLSPEQIQGREPDARADLYSLGVVLYESLVGQAPFVGDNDMATAMAHLNGRAPRVSERAGGIAPALDRLVSDLLAKDPDQRVSSASALRRRIDGLAGLRASGPSPAASDNSAQGRGAERLSGLGRSGAPLAGWRNRWQGELGRLGRPPAEPGRLGRPPAEPGAVTATIEGPPSAGPYRTAATGSGAAGGDERAGDAGRPGGVLPVEGASEPGSSTDELATVRRRQGRRRVRAPGVVVAALIAAGAVVAGLLLSSTGDGHDASRGAQSALAHARVVVSVQVFMDNGHPPDDPQGTHLVADGNPSTYWQTDIYSTPAFGNLYPGIGLEIELQGGSQLRSLVVTSPSTGWSAQTYVSPVAIASGGSLAAWGQPTDSQVSIAGNATFDLAGRRGRWVLLWLTNLGPARRVRIGEVSVT